MVFHFTEGDHQKSSMYTFLWGVLMNLPSGLGRKWNLKSLPWVTHQGIARAVSRDCLEKGRVSSIQTLVSFQFLFRFHILANLIISFQNLQTNLGEEFLMSLLKQKDLTHWMLKSGILSPEKILLVLLYV
jgi:hypothetical protein